MHGGRCKVCETPYTGSGFHDLGTSGTFGFFPNIRTILPDIHFGANLIAKKRIKMYAAVLEIIFGQTPKILTRLIKFAGTSPKSYS